MQAIVTKFIPYTNTRESRVKAIADAGSVTLHWDHALNVEQNHDRAAVALCQKFGWVGEHYSAVLVRGGMPLKSPYAYCYVQANRRAPEFDQVPLDGVK